MLTFEGSDCFPDVPIVQRPRTWPFQGQNTGSNPVGDATKGRQHRSRDQLARRHRCREPVAVPISLESQRFFQQLPAATAVHPQPSRSGVRASPPPPPALWPRWPRGRRNLMQRVSRPHLRDEGIAFLLPLRQQGDDGRQTRAALFDGGGEVLNLRVDAPQLPPKFLTRPSTFAGRSSFRKPSMIALTTAGRSTSPASALSTASLTRSIGSTRSFGQTVLPRFQFVRHP